MIKRINVPLEQDLYSALLEDAVAELRDPTNQMKYILRQDLTRRGLLPSDTPEPVNASTAQSVGVRHVQ